DADWNVITSAPTDTVGITSTDTNATLPANAALASGAQTFNVTLKTVGGGSQTLTASDITNGAKSPNTSPGITVNPGVLNNFLVEAAVGGAIPTQTAGSAFNIKITARDANNNTVTGFTGTATITSTGTLVGAPVTTATFASGVLTSHSVTISNTGSFTLTATNGSNGTSNALPVNARRLYDFQV